MESRPWGGARLVTAGRQRSCGTHMHTHAFSPRRRGAVDPSPRGGVGGFGCWISVVGLHTSLTTFVGLGLVGAGLVGAGSSLCENNTGLTVYRLALSSGSKSPSCGGSGSLSTTAARPDRGQILPSGLRARRGTHPSVPRRTPSADDPFPTKQFVERCALCIAHRGLCFRVRIPIATERLITSCVVVDTVVAEQSVCADPLVARPHHFLL